MSEKNQWTVEECSSLIERYRNHPNLWNASHIDSNSRIKEKIKYDSLKEIAQRFGTKYDEIERKLKYIVSQYQRERRNYKKLLTFKAKWFGYFAMCFLHDKNKPMKGSQVGLDFEDSNPSSSDDSDGNESQTCESTRNANESNLRELDGNISDVQIANQEHEVLEQNVGQQGSLGSDVLKSQETEQFKTPDPTKEGAKKRLSKQHLLSAKKSSKIVDTANTSTSVNEAFEMMKFVYQKTQTTETRDKYSILAELLGCTIRNLKTDFAKATVEHQIHNILYEAQIGKYDFPQYSSDTAYSYHHLLIIALRRRLLILYKLILMKHLMMS